LNEATIAEHFKPQGNTADISHVTTGNINKTFLVTLNGAEAKHFILQRINTDVFTQPELVMRNIRVFSDHVRARLTKNPLPENRHWEVPRVLHTPNGQDFWVAPDGSFWRAISFVEDAQSFNTAQSESHAQEVGWALGTFHALLDDLPIERLADTLPGFHIAPGYLAKYDATLFGPNSQALATRGEALFSGVDFCLKFVEERRSLVSVLEDAKAAKKLKLRPIHGDPKINNVMMDTRTDRAVSIIDLDTVTPGLVHYDIGDCLRSGCNLAGEETTDLSSVRFEPALGRAILSGYLSQAKSFLTPNDYDYLFDAIRLIAFELGLRFFADHLAGNVYFTADHDRHNLDRALVQFTLAKSIESQEAEIRSLIAEMR
jgi:Ser/Thr protein kinase RdoA (MazF antagonist)